MPILEWVSGGWSIVGMYGGADIYEKPRRPKMNELTTNLASYAHESWSGWMKYLFAQCKVNDDGSVTIPADKVERWTRQMNSDYKVLPSSEQLSDIDEAHKILAIFDDWTA
jgi:hypothetical protein